MLFFHQFYGGFFPSITHPHLLCFSWLPVTHLSLIPHSLSFSTLILAHWKFWAALNQAYWHRLVVDDFFFTVITHMRMCMHTDLVGMVVDEQIQSHSICAHQSPSRNCIRPPGHSVTLAPNLASRPSLFWEECEVLWMYNSQRGQSS